MLEFQKDFSAGEFASRRKRIVEAIGEGVAIVQGAPANGAFDRFRQTNEFYYLCGVEVPHAYLSIDGATGTSGLYLPRRDPQMERIEGRQWSCDDAEDLRALTGVEAVRPLDGLIADIGQPRRIFACHSPAEGRQMCRDELRHARALQAADPIVGGDPPPELALIAQFRARWPGAQICDLSSVLDRLRTVKSPREVELMRRSGSLTAAAIAEAMRATVPGMYEYRLAALADYRFAVEGAQGPGYRAIVAGGENIWNAHYFRNNCRLKDGDLVLMDYAPDLGYYTSDIGRMWPVSGRYSPLQRELYGFIVEYHKTLLRLIRPGALADQIHREAAKQMTAVVENTRWSKPSYEQAARNTLQFTGHLSHGVGMAVHDAGNYREEPLAPGIVFALDPQMWVHEEQLYIRVEDTVVVTESGVENLTAAAPVELDDVESHMQAGAAAGPI
ncbi:MAG TPA: aminopeptidase P N-terminal domain-containing protein [Pirellulales bacterium]|nr:aminopeptidase P N-terminal domain-containing protein [Pirellulales bacterium]